MKYILALDQGTTSSRAILFDSAGQIAGIAQKEFPQHFPRSGWVEHDAEDIWKTQLAVAKSVIRKVKTSAKEIAGIGITNQRETTVVWDRETGKPICNAIVWQDRRTAGMCDGLREQKLDRPIKKKTGLILDAYFSGTKIKWILDNVKGARRKADAGKLAFGTIDSFLLWRLTGGKVHATDATNASRTMLYNIKTEKWDQGLLDALDIPESLLPEVRSCSEIYGETTLLGGKLPIAGMAGDQHAALFGQCRLRRSKL
jgi:glycerol kinase